jgi:hypothetical protein
MSELPTGAGTLLFVQAKQAPLRPPKRGHGELNSPLRDLFCGALEEFVDQGLIGLGLLGGEAAKLGEETRRNANGNELFGVAGTRAADAAGAAASLRSERKASGAKAPELQGEVEGRGGRLCRSLSSDP